MTFFVRILISTVLLSSVVANVEAASEKPICLPIGHAALWALPLRTPFELKKDFVIGGFKFPAGCKLNVSYGPEFSSDESESRRKKKRIIQSANCEKGVRLGRYLVQDPRFDGDFCLDGPVSILKPAIACEVSFEVGEDLPFVAGIPDCGEIVPGSNPESSKRRGCE